MDCSSSSPSWRASSCSIATHCTKFYSATSASRTCWAVWSGIRRGHGRNGIASTFATLPVSRRWFRWRIPNCTRRSSKCIKCSTFRTSYCRRRPCSRTTSSTPCSPLSFSIRWKSSTWSRRMSGFWRLSLLNWQIQVKLQSHLFWLFWFCTNFLSVNWIVWLFDWSIVIGWSIDWLIDWLTDWLLFDLSQFKFVMKHLLDFFLISFAETPVVQRRDAVLFLKEFCQFSHTLQPPARENFFRMLMAHGILQAVQAALDVPDQKMRTAIVDVFTYIVEIHPFVVREFSMSQAMKEADDEKLFFVRIIHQAVVNDPDPQAACAMQVGFFCSLFVLLPDISRCLKKTNENNEEQ